MAYTEYVTQHKNSKTDLNVFLKEKGTMLQGKIVDFDDVCIILDKCLIFHDQIISIVPQRK
jgi:sRNA-binding regulator protein Hfq